LCHWNFKSFCNGHVRASIVFQDRLLPRAASLFWGSDRAAALKTCDDGANAEYFPFDYLRITREKKVDNGKKTLTPHARLKPLTQSPKLGVQIKEKRRVDDSLDSANDKTGSTQTLILLQFIYFKGDASAHATAAKEQA
jgi:hypothetical protein